MELQDWKRLLLTQIEKDKRIEIHCDNGFRLFRIKEICEQVLKNNNIKYHTIKYKTDLYLISNHTRIHLLMVLPQSVYNKSDIRYYCGNIQKKYVELVENYNG